MFDFPNKIITVILVFLMLIIAPLMFVYARQSLITHREVLNSMNQFLGEVADTGEVTNQELNTLYINLNASGGFYTATVKRYMPTPLPTSVGNSRLLYTAVPYETDGTPLVIPQGNLVKVTVKSVGVSPTARIFWSVLGLNQDTRPLSLVTVVQ